MKLLLCLVVASLLASWSWAVTAHRMSYMGIKPYTDKGTTLGPFRDDDEDYYYCDVWMIQNGTIALLGYRYIDAEKYWKDQKYVVGVSNVDLENDEAFGVNAGLVYEVGVSRGDWNSISKDFSTSGTGDPWGSPWDHGYNADPSGYNVRTLMPPNEGKAAGVWLVGLKAVRADNSVRKGRLVETFWPATAISKNGNVFKVGSSSTDPGGTGEDGGAGSDPNGPDNGWGSILSNDFWKKLFIFLFIPSEEDCNLLKESFMQFEEWGPFKLIADISESLGDISGGSMGDLTADYKIHLGTYGSGVWGNDVNLDIDCSPFASWVRLLRAIFLGFFMIKLGAFWWPKYQAIMSRS